MSIGVTGKVRGGNEMIFTDGYQRKCGIHIFELTRGDIYQYYFYHDAIISHG